VSAAPSGDAAGDVARVDPASFPVTPRAWAQDGRGARPGDEVGDGPFGRALTAFAWSLGLTALLTAANLPLVLLALLLRPDPSLTWLAALAAIPLGPALSAGLSAVRARYVDPDVGVARAFGRGYRLGWRDASVLSVPACLLGAVVTLVATSGRGAGVPAVLSGLAAGAGVLLLLLTLHALALRTFFRMPAPDALQLAAFFLVARWRASLGVLALVVGAAVVAAAASDLLLALLAGVGVWLWYRITAPVLRDAGARFLPAAAATASPGDHP